MSTRHGWHEYLWVHVTGDMNIHDYTSRETWIFMITHHGRHEYSWAHMTQGTWIFIVQWHILIPGFLIVPKSRGALPYSKVGLRYERLKTPLKLGLCSFTVAAPDFGGHRGNKMYIWGGKNSKKKILKVRLIFVFLLISGLSFSTE